MGKFEIRHCDSCGSWRPAWKSIEGIGTVCKTCALEVVQ